MICVDQECLVVALLHRATHEAATSVGATTTAIQESVSATTLAAKHLVSLWRSLLFSVTLGSNRRASQNSNHAIPEGILIVDAIPRQN